MKKLLKIIVGILVVLVLAMGALFYALQPEGGIQKDTTGNKEMTKQDVIQMGVLESLEYNKKTGNFEGSMSFTAEDLSNILYTFMRNYDIDDVISNDIKIEGNKLIVTAPLELEFINTQAEFSIVPSVENGDLLATVENIKVGKIDISGKLLSMIMQSQQDEIPFEIRDRAIVISTETLKPIQITSMKVEDDKLKVDMKIALKDVLQYVYGSLVEQRIEKSAA